MYYCWLLIVFHFDIVNTGEFFPSYFALNTSWVSLGFAHIVLGHGKS